MESVTGSGKNINSVRQSTDLTGYPYHAGYRTGSSLSSVCQDASMLTMSNVSQSMHEDELTVPHK